MLRSRTILPTLLGVFLAGLLWASDKTPVTSNAKLFNSLESETRIMSDIYYLTSEECEGRGSTTAGIHKAADYIVARLKQAGLQPAGVEGTYFQPFDFKLAPPRLGEKNSLSLNLGSEKVALDAKEFQVMGAGNAGLVENAPVAFAGYGIQSEAPSYNDYEELNAEGKVVIILRRTPRQPDNADPKFKDDLATLTSKINLATEQKAQAILLVNDSSVKEADEIVRFHFAGTRGKKETPPVFHVKRSVVNKLLAEAGSETLEELENKIASDLKPRSRVLEKVSLSLQADINRDGFKINNIIATVPGAGELADEVVVVGSHYDHVGRGETGSLAGSREIHHGADDNASGSCCNLEIARRWQELQSGPHALKNRRRVVFQWYAAEEWGLIGSDYYVKNPLFPLEKTASMLNLDMVGRLGFDENKLAKNLDEAGIKRAREKSYPLEINGVTSAKEFEALVDKANADLKVEVIKPRSSQFFGASDHYSFYKKNIPVLFFFTGMHPQYHRPTDVWQTINIKGIRQCAELGQNILEELASMPRPEFVKAETQTRRRTAESPAKIEPAKKIEAEKKPDAEKKPEPEKKMAQAENKSATDPHAGLSADGSKDDLPRVKVPRFGIMFDYNDPGPGVLVDNVTAGKPAAKAGLKSGDRILEAD
ncbi:MAG TPA: M28 family peptidase, partial [Gemmatales bacterium]|nr:M28 family peptidase [Gemmatales bacterium]